MSIEPEYKTTDEIDAVQSALDEIGTGWRCVAIDGMGKQDHRAYFLASRPASNSIVEVIHRSGTTVVQLAKETDLRLGATKPVKVTEGLDSTSGGTQT